MTTQRPGTHKPPCLLCLGSLLEGYLRSLLEGHRHLGRCPGAEAKKIYRQCPNCEIKPSQGTFLCPVTAEPSPPHTFSRSSRVELMATRLVRKQPNQSCIVCGEHKGGLMTEIGGDSWKASPDCTEHIVNQMHKDRLEQPGPGEPSLWVLTASNGTQRR